MGDRPPLMLGDEQEATEPEALELGSFGTILPKPAPDTAEIFKNAAALNYTSREADGQGGKKPKRRRKTTGRTAAKGFKLRPDAVKAFDNLADHLDKTDGAVFEEMLELYTSETTLTLSSDLVKQFLETVKKSGKTADTVFSEMIGNHPYPTEQNKKKNAR